MNEGFNTNSEVLTTKTCIDKRADVIKKIVLWPLKITSLFKLFSNPRNKTYVNNEIFKMITKQLINRILSKIARGVEYRKYRNVPGSLPPLLPSGPASGTLEKFKRFMAL